MLRPSGGRPARDLRGDRAAVDLLLTDVVMPEMLGPELAVEASGRRPGLRVLYMSGYVHQVVAGMEDEQADAFSFVEKPFTGDTLLSAIRLALDASPAGAGAT